MCSVATVVVDSRSTRLISRSSAAIRGISMPVGVGSRWAMVCLSPSSRDCMVLRFLRTSARHPPSARNGRSRSTAMSSGRARDANAFSTWGSACCNGRIVPHWSIRGRHVGCAGASDAVVRTRCAPAGCFVALSGPARVAACRPVPVRPAHPATDRSRDGHRPKWPASAARRPSPTLTPTRLPARSSGRPPRLLRPPVRPGWPSAVRWPPPTVISGEACCWGGERARHPAASAAQRISSLRADRHRPLTYPAAP